MSGGTHPVALTCALQQQLAAPFPVGGLCPRSDLCLLRFILCLIPGYLQPVVSVVHCGA